ncbi:low molecular weight protein arginine phosphatase [Camelliibacillus cellulosilyticus]|uniref:Low molecular weight protein arginine phosphatase n=1 Tax=Camelliibacillus cellulosilyticus TaxID=2174486 RepID=A0ABV9GNQ6_9BACL
MKNVLFVCTGNTCRSPMAEAILKSKASDRYLVKSAGVFAVPGQTAHPHAQKVLKDRGIKVHHRSQNVTSELVSWADVILTMTQGHKKALLQKYPEAIMKTMTLKEYIEPDSSWEEWQKVVADYETKQAVYKQAHSNQKLDGNKKKALKQEVDEAFVKVKDLESQWTDLDIADPYGASVETYEMVCRELEELIDRLLEKDV